jgi:hypothetical protein
VGRLGWRRETSGFAVSIFRGLTASCRGARERKGTQRQRSLRVHILSRSSGDQATTGAQLAYGGTSAGPTAIGSRRLLACRRTCPDGASG